MFIEDFDDIKKCVLGPISNIFKGSIWEKSVSVETFWIHDVPWSRRSFSAREERSISHNSGVPKSGKIGVMTSPPVNAVNGPVAYSGQPGSLSQDWSANMAKALPKLEK